MVETYTGSNAFLLHRTLEGRVARFVDAHGDLALTRLDASETAYGQLLEAVTAVPFLVDKKNGRYPGPRRQQTGRGKG